MFWLLLLFYYLIWPMKRRCTHIYTYFSCFLSHKYNSLLLSIYAITRFNQLIYKCIALMQYIRNLYWNTMKALFIILIAISFRMNQGISWKIHSFLFISSSRLYHIWLLLITFMTCLEYIHVSSCKVLLMKSYLPHIQIWTLNSIKRTCEEIAILNEFPIK